MRQPAQAARRPETDERRDTSPKPGFKPIALPALAAAIEAVRMQPRAGKQDEPPAILRKEPEHG
jgi:hypothetical protein